MEILLIIMLAPLALAAGFGLIRLLMEPVTWAILLGLLGIFGMFLGR
jgi:hypothetical protein